MDQHPSNHQPSSAQNSEIPTLVSIVEALLFTSQKALSLKELVSLLQSASTALQEEIQKTFTSMSEQKIREALEMLHEDLSTSKRAYELRETASGWQLVTKSLFAPWLRQLFREVRPSRLSPPALETLAIIAYRQPITRADLEAIRGVAVDGVVQTLLDRGLIRITGRADIPGRPLLYATSQLFLDHFGLLSLNELPNATELGKIPLPRAPLPSPKKEQERTSSQESEEGKLTFYSS